jgi:hypothetical protein
MKPHQRHGAVVLGAAILATAVVLGIARWHQPTPAGEVATTSSSASDTGHFTQIPRASDAGIQAEGRLPGKVGPRPLRADPAAEIDQPRPGETVYLMSNLPKECGTYWVQSANGEYSRLSVCHPENHPGRGH